MTEIEGLHLLMFLAGFLLFILILVACNFPILFVVASFAVFVFVRAFIVRTCIRARMQGEETC